MDIIKKNYLLLCSNTHPTNNSGDIREHLPTLCKYANECDSVFETGVRGCVSSWAFLYGLLNNNSSVNKKVLFLNDITSCNIEELLSISKNFDIDVKYEWKNNLLLNLNKNYDITFIDTWHIYGQLKRELNKFSKITNKYIIMHDTTVDEIYGETIRCGFDARKQSIESGSPIEEIKKGLWPAVVEFLQNNKDWYLKERFTNNNGLTILARK
jgi:hypothetical protein